jgi:hypothetical protein
MELRFCEKAIWRFCFFKARNPSVDPGISAPIRPEFPPLKDFRGTGNLKDFRPWIFG